MITDQFLTNFILLSQNVNMILAKFNYLKDETTHIYIPSVFFRLVPYQNIGYSLAFRILSVPLPH